MNQTGGYELNKIYWNGYWQSYHKIIHINNNTGDWRQWCVVSQWQDGHTTEHCTELDKRRDREATVEEWEQAKTF